MKKVENPFQEAKQILRPLKDRPDLDPDQEFIATLNKRILHQNIKKAPKLKLYPILAIVSVLTIFTIVILSFQNQDHLANDTEDAITIADTSKLEMLDTFVYGNGEGKVGLEFLGERNTLPVTVSSFDVQDGTVYLLDEARKQVLIRNVEGTTTSMPIQTYLMDLESGLEDIVVTETGNMYILSTKESLVYHYDANGVLVENFDYSKLEMFYPDSLIELANGEIVLSQSQERFVNLGTMEQIPEEDLPYRFERVNRKENKLITNEKNISKELTVFSDLSIDSSSVETMNNNQIILTKTVSPPLYTPISETHVLALSKEGDIVGGVRIPFEDFLEKPQHPERFVAIDNNKIYILIADNHFVTLYEATLGKHYESHIKEQTELLQVGYDYQSFGKPFPELEKEINALLKNKKLEYGQEDSLNGVAINEKGTVVIDFKDFLASGPTSAQGQHLFQTLNEATFEKFPEIQEIYYQFDGSFSAWCLWLGSTEESWKRPNYAGDWTESSPEISEYSSMQNWMDETKKLIKSGNLDNMTKESFEIHIGSTTTSYANYYIERATDEGTIEQLNAIKEKAIQITSEMDDKKREALMKELSSLLEK
ncbi:hypothetical protein [Ornithinibacillus californiensis]|uniref:hypothetical protein n=1 Tax=Ornithinibacillus californiensis TaxID=161536 RepID=UPI00064DAD9D|nr:hypothetical protein [Ornithinibacillus californiensis]